ncbi:MAG: hypothetical protein ACE5EQ_04340 [Phycisphaerae bacterium]
MGLAIGCSGGNLDTSVRMSATVRPDIGPALVAAGSMAIPEQTPFVYRRFNSAQQGDSARGEARAISTDGAGCRAEVSGEGSAWGSFKLGHCFDNLTGKPLDAVVKVRLGVDWSLDHRTAKAPASGTGSLVFFVKDTHAIELRRETLLSSDLEKGPTTAVPHHELVFDARLEPGLGYYFILAGRVDVASEAGQSATVEMNVTDVAIEIDWKAERATARVEEPGVDNDADPVQASGLNPS